MNGNDVLIHYVQFLIAIYILLSQMQDFFLENLQLIKVKREDVKGKQILATSEKYYIADHGVRKAVFGRNMKDINLVLENIVFMKALRRGYDVTVGRTAKREFDMSRNGIVHKNICEFLKAE